MVGRLFRSVFLATVLGLLPQLQAKESPEYRLGSTIQSNVVAPIRLVVTDPDATQELKAKEAQKVFAICRYYPRAADEAEGALRQAFANARREFLDYVEKAFNHRRLNPDEEASEKFHKLVGSYESLNRFPPLDFKLAATWARAGSDAVVLDPLLSHLHAAMNRAVRPDRLPDGIKLTYTLRLAVLTNLNTAPTLVMVDHQNKTMARTNVITFSRQRSRLLQSFPENQQLWAKFAASFLRENLIPDAELTRQAREKETGALQVTDTYEAGQLIAKRGDVVNRKILAALNQLEQMQPEQPALPKTAPDPSATSRRLAQNGHESAGNPPADVQSGPARNQTAANDPQLRWIFGALVGIFVLLLVIIWLVARRQNPATMLPARVDRDLLETPMSSDGVIRQGRRLLAGQPAADTQAAARATLVQHFGQWLSDKMTRRLVQQRAELLDAHQTATSEIAELDARLEKVHAPLHDRLRVYEQRILELEKELNLKSEENRELTKLKIELVRKRVEEGQNGPRLLVHPGQANAWEIRLQPGTHTIGRDSIADFRIDDASISGRHCEIIISDAGVMIKDLDSTNGTRINGNEIQAAVLQSGQRIHLGNVELLFSAEDLSEAQAAAEVGRNTARN